MWSLEHTDSPIVVQDACLLRLRELQSITHRPAGPASCCYAKNDPRLITEAEEMKRCIGRLCTQLRVRQLVLPLSPAADGAQTDAATGSAEVTLEAVPMH